MHACASLFLPEEWMDERVLNVSFILLKRWENIWKVHISK